MGASPAEKSSIRAWGDFSNQRLSAGYKNKNSQASTGIQEFTASSDEEYGSFVGPVGDLDGDGTIYFIIGALSNDEGASDGGKIYIKTQGRIAM